MSDAVDAVADHPRVIALARDPDDRLRSSAFARDLARYLVGGSADRCAPLARVVIAVAQRTFDDARALCRGRPLLAVESAARATEALWPFLRGAPDAVEAPSEPPPPTASSDPDDGSEAEAADGAGGEEIDAPAAVPSSTPGSAADAEAPGADAEPTSAALRAWLQALEEAGEGAAVEAAAEAAADGAVAGDRLVRTLEQLAPGVGWSTAPGALERQALAQLDRVASLLQRMPQLRWLADQLGRMEDAARRDGRSSGGRESVVGVHLGGEAALALPSELALLGDPATEDLFYQRLLEHRLVSLALAGAGDGGVGRPARRGPVIACIDTSASMAGPPELVAKALVLAICRRVVPRGRAVHLILFGGFGERTEVLLRRGRGGLEGLLAFLDHAFQAGTDFDGPLMRAMSLLEEADLAAADVLVVTDALARAHDRVIARVNAVRAARGVRIWSVVLGRADPVGVAPFSDRIFQLDPAAPDDAGAVVAAMAV
jgi:uncharacterized protein with von Willebrand factor type A (vWA) domain